MNENWDNLVESLRILRELVVGQETQPVSVGGGIMIADPDDLWETCRYQLDEVLMPTDEHALLVNRIQNGQAYFSFGHSGAAHWELNQAYLRCRHLRKLYA